MSGPAPASRDAPRPCPAGVPFDLPATAPPGNPPTRPSPAPHRSRTRPPTPALDFQHRPDTRPGITTNKSTHRPEPAARLRDTRPGLSKRNDLHPGLRTGPATPAWVSDCVTAPAPVLHHPLGPPPRSHDRPLRPPPRSFKADSVPAPVSQPALRPFAPQLGLGTPSVPAPVYDCVAPHPPSVPRTGPPTGPVSLRPGLPTDPSGPRPDLIIILYHPRPHPTTDARSSAPFSHRPFQPSPRCNYRVPTPAPVFRPPFPPRSFKKGLGTRPGLAKGPTAPAPGP